MKYEWYVKEIQKYLNFKGYATLREDGLAGEETLKAVRLFTLANAGLEKDGAEIFMRKVFQIILKNEGVYEGVIDGIIGHYTQEAFQLYHERDLTQGRRSSVRSVAEAATPSASGVADMYGPVDTVPDKLVMIDLPYTMKLAWDPGVKINRFLIHNLVAKKAVKAMTAIREAYTLEERARHGFDLFGGCYNKRKMRGGSQWSTHAYGIAIDFDPERNGLHTPFSRSYMGRPECQKFVDIWQQHGFYNLGKWRDFDAMHFQACHPGIKK